MENDDKYAPRRPTPEELKGITEANFIHFGDEYQPDFIAVWDNYISDCPGYVGWVALSFGGVPDYITGYTKTHGGSIEVCSFGSDEGYARSKMPDPRPISTGHPDEFDDREFGGKS